jgi:hypothetical protein
MQNEDSASSANRQELILEDMLNVNKIQTDGVENEKLCDRHA